MSNYRIRIQLEIIDDLDEAVSIPTTMIISGEDSLANTRGIANRFYGILDQIASLCNR